MFTAGALLLTIGLFTNCGSVERTDMFSHSNAALVENLGQTCDAEPVLGTEVIVEDDDEQCMPGYCVNRGGIPGADEGQGICTCRCAGPEGTGPLCDCGADYVCQDLIKPFDGLGGEHLVGAYCVPAQ